MAKSFAQKLCTIVDGIECYNFFKNTKSDIQQVATSTECNFIMGTILGKGFAQALVHIIKSTCAFGTGALTICTCAWAKSFPKIVPMVKLDSLSSKVI